MTVYRGLFVEGEDYDKYIEHLRVKQGQVWASASSTLTFDSIMVAATLFLAPLNSFGKLPYLITADLTAFLVSAMLCVYAMNHHGSYAPALSQREAIDKYSAGVIYETGLCFAGIVIAYLASALFVGLVWTRTDWTNHG